METSGNSEDQRIRHDKRRNSSLSSRTSEKGNKTLTDNPQVAKRC